MATISPERLQRYTELANRDLWDLKDEKFAAFFKRAKEEGAELVSNGFSDQGMFRAPHKKKLTGLDMALVGIPLDLGVPNPRPGTRKGPEVLRYWSLDRNIVHHVTGVVPYDICNIADWGDIEFTTDVYNLDACLEAIYQQYKLFQSSDIVPFSVGGEHTCTYPILRALSEDGEQPLALVHLDAHADTSIGFGGTRVSDASLFQVATVDGLIDPEKTIQIGIRGRGTPRCEFSHASGMHVVYAEELQDKGVAAITDKIQKVIGDARVYLTIDTDVFDCSVMPGTTLPEPFGLSGVEVRDIIRSMRNLDVVGADLMELSQIYDPTGMSGCLASAIAFEQICLLAEARQRRTGITHQTHWNRSA